jgi:hypothetical protein
MFIQIDNDIIEVLNDDVLFIVISENEKGPSEERGPGERRENDLISIYLIRRNEEKIFGKMTKHSLDIYSKFIMDKEKWNLFKLNIFK